MVVRQENCTRARLVVTGSKAEGDEAVFLFDHASGKGGEEAPRLGRCAMRTPREAMELVIGGHGVSRIQNPDLNTRALGTTKGGTDRCGETLPEDFPGTLQVQGVGPIAAENMLARRSSVWRPHASRRRCSMNQAVF